MEKKLVPELRFPEFSEEWEKKRLGDLLDERNDQIPENEEYPLMSFVQGSGVTPKSARYDRSFLVRDEQKKYKKTELNDFIYSSNNLETGSIGLNRTGKAVISPVYSIFSSKSKLESQFIGIMAQRKEFIAKMLRYRQGVIYGQWCIHESDFLSIKVRVPFHEEQEKIASFFELIDKRIEKQEEKIASIEDYKSGMLQKLFPKKGEDVPELRFKGFTDPWEQRKLGEVAKFSKGRGYSKNDLTEEGTPIILYGSLYTNYQTVINEVNTFTVDKVNSVYSLGNEVVVPSSGESAEDIARASAIVNKGIILGGDLNIIHSNSNIDPIFLALLISNGERKIELAKKAQGKSVVHLYNTDLEEVNLIYPTREEQTRISDFFSSLDNLITLHQRKLEELKELKKGFMQKMFI